MLLFFFFGSAQALILFFFISRCIESFFFLFLVGFVRSFIGENHDGNDRKKTFTQKKKKEKKVLIKPGHVIDQASYYVYHVNLLILKPRKN